MERISMADYNRRPGVRSGECRALALGKTLAHIKEGRENPSVPTKSMILGTAVHGLISGDTSEFHIRQFDGRTKDGKEEVARALVENPDVEFLSAEDGLKASKMATSGLENRTFAGLAKHATFEPSLFWGGCKARPDVVVEGQGIIIDIKTAKDASWDGFLKAIRYGRYDIQAAMQIQGMQATLGIGGWKYGWLVIENEPPYLSNLVWADSTVLAFGRSTYEQMVSQIMDAEESNCWPGYEDVTVTADDLWR